MIARRVEIGGVAVGAGERLVLVSGPCVVEDAATMAAAAGGLVEICGRLGVPLVFKASFEKDNRTRPEAYRGPGRGAGLAALAAVRARFGVPVISDVHRVEDVAPAAAALDALQIPALLSRQSRLLEAAARCGRPVNVKKGVAMTTAAAAGARDKLRGAGAPGVLLTERGASFGPGRLVVDMAGIPALRALGCPVLMDAGHAANAPEEIETLALAGVAAGADGLYLETHPEPGRALCDGPRMLPLDRLGSLLERALGVARAVGRR